MNSVDHVMPSAYGASGYHDSETTASTWARLGTACRGSGVLSPRPPSELTKGAHAHYLHATVNGGSRRVHWPLGLILVGYQEFLQLSRSKSSLVLV